MRIDTLKQRIENARTKIEKKQNTITKKEGYIEKKTAKMQKMEADSWEAKCMRYDIASLKDDIERLHREIAEAQASLEKYEKQLTGEMEKESLLIYEIPETMKRMQTELVEKWDAWDIERREYIKECVRTKSYDEYRKELSPHELYTLYYQTDEQIHKSNLEDAKAAIISLYYRVRAITGEVTDWSGLCCSEVALNGYIIGKEGRAVVETILAGGYNIQRLHCRTLVHEVR